MKFIVLGSTKKRRNTMNFQQSFPTSTGNNQMSIGSYGMNSAGGQSQGYQPTGAVTSFYGQSQGTFPQSGFSSSLGNTQGYHMANYQGNQPGHDQDLRGDSTRPAQQGGSAFLGRTGFQAGVNPDARQSGGQGYYGMGQSSMGSMGQSSMGGMGQSSMGSMGQGSFGGQNSYQQTNPSQSYHMANYQGNQPGHDQDLRGDSTRPAQQGGSAFLGRTGFQAGVNPDARQSGAQGSYGMGQSSMGGMGQGSYGMGQSSMGGMGQGSYGMGQSSMGGMGQGSSSMGQSSMGSMGQGSYGMGQSSMGGMGQGSYGMGQSSMGGMGQGSFGGSSEQYHMANYQGDQPGHDQDLRGDSSRPAQQGGSAFLGRTGFQAGVNPDARQGSQNYGGGFY
jgi:hypothetical protein